MPDLKTSHYFTLKHIMQASRAFLGQVNKNFPTMPFTLREFDDPRQARMGVVECIKHELLHSYPVLWEREGDCVSHFKFTVLLLPSGTHRITGVDPPNDYFKSSKVVFPSHNRIMLCNLSSNYSALIGSHIPLRRCCQRK